MDKPIERQKLYTAIKSVYSGGKELTARECSEELKKMNIVRYGTRQESQPRIVEMISLGWLECIGSKFDVVTRKTVSIYKEVANG